jgi:hypothetical protein
LLQALQQAKIKEAKAIRQISCPQIATIFEIGQFEGHYFMVRHALIDSFCSFNATG